MTAKFGVAAGQHPRLPRARRRLGRRLPGPRGLGREERRRRAGPLRPPRGHPPAPPASGTSRASAAPPSWPTPSRPSRSWPTCSAASPPSSATSPSARWTTGSGPARPTTFGAMCERLGDERLPGVRGAGVAAPHAPRVSQVSPRRAPSPRPCGPRARPPADPDGRPPRQHGDHARAGRRRRRRRPPPTLAAPKPVASTGADRPARSRTSRPPAAAGRRPPSRAIARPDGACSRRAPRHAQEPSARRRVGLGDAITRRRRPARRGRRRRATAAPQASRRRRSTRSPRPCRPGSRPASRTAEHAARSSGGRRSHRRRRSSMDRTAEGSNEVGLAGATRPGRVARAADGDLTRVRGWRGERREVDPAAAATSGSARCPRRGRTRPATRW